MEKEKDVVAISNSDELFARRLALYLGKNPDVSNDVQARLDSARVIAIATMKKSLPVEITVTTQDKESVMHWFKKNYASFSNNLVALALVVLAVPIGMNVIDFDSEIQSRMTSINKVVGADDLYLENTYHMKADDLDDDYLEDLGFI